MPRPKKKAEKDRYRYGIGEWYGHSFSALGPKERQGLAAKSLASTRPELPCRFRSTVDIEVLCTKKGGVCSLRLYGQNPKTGVVSIPQGPRSTVVTLCPHRFKEDEEIYEWIGETLLNNSTPLIAGEVPFLERYAVDGETGEDSGTEDVGRIDNVLVHPNRDPMDWCALEMQAVYFSGRGMTKEFKIIKSWAKPEILFPAEMRRPDYRSSGPKRLMPQLQIKVPTLRRWGKKMAVVVDRSFFDALGKMDTVKEVSNCDIAWFVVKYSEQGRHFVLERDSVILTTLERAVEGLTGGRPVGLEEFEKRIRAKLRKTHSSS